MRYLILTAMLLGVLVSSCKKETPTPEEEMNDPVVTSAPQHMVLIEPTVSVNCGACPLAHHEIEVLEEESEKVTHMSHYIYGPLYHPYTKYLLDKINKTVYTPLGHVDRRHEDGSVVYYPVNMFKGILGMEIEESTGIDLTVKRANAENSIELEIEVTTQSQSLKEDMMITVVLIEKEVTGMGNGYDQRNYGNSDPDHPYFERGDWIEGFVHTHVIRDVYTAFEGDALNLSTGTDNWSYTIQHSELEKDASAYAVIAFVNRPGDAIQPILNTIQAELAE
ncbi:MAG: Omp28-related outer membrane protein [Flavobacteriales bacterium]|nr:Omp28-related outer membrane protein [Flavobacteriales bacterium]